MADSLPRRVWRDTAVIFRLKPGGWLDLLRAAGELALARYRLSTSAPKDLLRQTPLQSLPDQPPHDPAALPARVAFAIPRVAARVPWRSDCFVQALAAQRWLQRKNIPSALMIGTRKDADGAFQAHAWLTCNDRIITGGDVSGYVPLVTPTTTL